MIIAIASKFRQVVARCNRFITYFYRHHSKNQSRHSLTPHIYLALVGGLLVLLLVGHPVIAQQPQPTQPLLVATRAIPPFVFSDKGQLAGFSIDLWRSIASQLGLQSKFIEYSTVVDLLSAVKNGTANLGISAISITAERQQNFDFSLPMFAAGLQILVRNPEANSGGVPNILQIFFSAAFLQLIMVALVLIVISAHIIWWFERRHEDGMIAKEYFPGIFKAYWWAAATLATQADEMPKGPLGRLIAIIWMFIGVLFVTYFTAIATTSLTVQQLQGDIKSVSDLPGKIVATTSGSTAAAFLRERKISALEVPNIDQAYKALLQKKADAVVFDAPVILFYAANEGKGKVEVIGSIFRDESYGIVLPNNSPYRKQINSALLSLKEDGTYQTLYDKWFKAKE